MKSKYKENLYCGIAISLMQMIASAKLYITSDCFNLSVTCSPSSNDGPIYQNNISAIPSEIDIYLSCPNESDFFIITDAKYSYPALVTDYCLDGKEKCSEKYPFNCCTKPQNSICTKPLSNYENICNGARGSCSVSIPQVSFTNEDCSMIDYPCIQEGKHMCVSRWIDMHYVCTKRLPTVTDKGLYFISRDFEMKNMKILVILSAVCGVLLISTLVFVILFLTARLHRKPIGISQTTQANRSRFLEGDTQPLYSETKTANRDSLLTDANYEEIAGARQDVVNLPSEYISVEEGKLLTGGAKYAEISEVGQDAGDVPSEYMTILPYDGYEVPIQTNAHYHNT